MLNSTHYNRQTVALSRRFIVFTFLLSAFSAPLHAEEVTLQFRDLTLNANLELAEGKALSDGVVLMLHGYMAHNRMEIIQTFQEIFKENGQSSLAINLSLGVDNRHGFYDCAVPIRHKLEDAIDELDAWVGWLKGKGVQRITFLGHSSAPKQILAFTAQHDDPVISELILVAPTTNHYKRRVNRYKTRYGRSPKDDVERARKLVAAGKGSELMNDIDFASCPKATVTADAFYSLYREDPPLGQIFEYLPQVREPVLIVIASMDDRQPEAASDLTPFVDDKRIQMAVIDGAGHFFRDLYAEEAVEATVAFLEAPR